MHTDEPRYSHGDRENLNILIKTRVIQLQKRGDDLQERNEKLEEEVCRMRKLLKDAEEEIRAQDQRIVVCSHLIKGRTGSLVNNTSVFIR